MVSYKILYKNPNIARRYLNDCITREDWEAFNYALEMIKKYEDEHMNKILRGKK